MTAAIITLSLACLALTTGMIASFVWGRREMTARVDAEEDKLTVEKKAADLEDERDGLKAFVVKAEAERDGAREAMAVAMADAAAAREELTKHVREKLVTGSDGDVSAEVDRLLGGRKVQAVPIVPAPTTGGDNGKA